MIVSSYAWLLSSIVQERWNAADPNPQRNHLFDYDVPERLRPLFRILQNIDPLSLLYKYSASWRNKIPTNMAWLTGKQPSYPRRRDPESRIEDEITPTTRRLDCANKVLLAGNDSQTFAGKLNLSVVGLAPAYAFRYCLVDQCSHPIQHLNFLPYAYHI